MEKKQTVTIIGAGLAGCFLAIVLAKKGYKVNVYERLDKDEAISSASKRSFNLTFYNYVVGVLKELDLWSEIESILVPVEGMITQVTQNPISNRFNKASVGQHIVQRDKLLKCLVDEAKKSDLITFHFSTNLISIDKQKKTITLENESSKKRSTASCDVIFGADGVNSKVRESLQEGQEFNHEQEYADWEYKQILIKSEEAKKINLKSNMIYGWTRKFAILLAHPNLDGSFSGLLILPKNPKKGFAALKSKLEIEEFFKQNFSDLVPIIPFIEKDILENPTGYFVTIYTTPWYYDNFITIVGDAAHGFLPFIGQGMSAAFGDCMEIGKLIDKYGSDWSKIFAEYQLSRKRNMDALANLSKESFTSYTRHKKADYNAVYYKLETILNKLFPNIFVGLPFVEITSNPNFTADYVEKHKKQRKITKYIGLSLLVHAITGLVAIEEKLSLYLHPQKKDFHPK